MIRLRLREHAIWRTSCVEIIGDRGELLGVVYANPVGVRVVSKYLPPNPLRACSTDGFLALGSDVTIDLTTPWEGRPE